MHSKFRTTKPSQPNFDKSFLFHHRFQIHQDCCNDDPIIDDRTKSSHVVNAQGILLNADCGGPAPGGCAPIGGSDDYCGGTMNDSFANKTLNYDDPDMNQVQENVPFSEIYPLFFLQ